MNPVIEAPQKKETPEQWGGGAPPPPPEPPDDNGGDGGGEDDSPDSLPAGKPLLGNTQLAMLVLIAAEIMFFSGLVGAFLVSSASAENPGRRPFSRACRWKSPPSTRSSFC